MFAALIFRNKKSYLINDEFIVLEWTESEFRIYYNNRTHECNQWLIELKNADHTDMNEDHDNHIFTDEVPGDHYTIWKQKLSVFYFLANF